MPKDKDETQLALEQEVIRLRNNLMQNVRRAKNRGYTFSTNYVPNLPKKITEGTLRKFKKFTTEHMYKHSVYVSPEGTKQKGYERRAEEYSESAKKGAQTRMKYYKEAETPVGGPKKVPVETPASVAEVLLINIEDLMWQIEYSRYDRSIIWTHNVNKKPLEDYKKDDSNDMLAALKDAIAKDGKEVVLKRINEKATEIYEIINQVFLSSGDKYYKDARDAIINAQVQKFAKIVQGGPITAEQSMYFTEMAEKKQGYINPQ